MYITDGQWPWPHHPARPDAAGDGLAVDRSTTVTAFQLRPATVAAAADWAGLQQIVLDGAPALRMPNGGAAVAQLGDYLVRDHAGHLEVVPAAQFAQQYQPAKGS